MNFKTTLVILAIFVALGAAYLLLLKPDPGADDAKQAQEKIRGAYGLDVDSLQRVRLSYADTAFAALTLAKSADGSWQLTDPVAARADTPKVVEMLNDFLEKRVKQTLEATNQAQYGLDPPVIQVEFWQEGAQPAKTFFIGAQTINYSVYAKEKSEAHIFLIESSALSELTRSASDLRDRDVLAFRPDEITRLTLRAAGGAEIQCERKDAGEWEVVQPVRAKADMGEISGWLAALDSVRVSTFEADGDYDASKYGLNAPRLSLMVYRADSDHPETLTVGGDVSGAARMYVARPEHRAVYTVDKAIYPSLNKAVFDLRDKRVIDFQRTAAQRFEIQQGERTLVVEKSARGEWEIKSPVSLKADPKAVDDLLFGVDALKATAFVDDQPKNLSAYGLDRPGLQATFMTADADPVTLLLGSKKGEQVYAKAKHAAPVYLVKGEILDLLGAGVAGLRNKQALDFKSDDAAKVILKYPDATIVCQKQGANWRLTAPVQENAKNGAVTAIVYQVNALKAERFLSDVPRLAETGLDTPDVQLSVVLKNGTEHVLQIGKPTQDGNRYARLRSSPETVFLVTETLLEALKVTVDDLRETPEPG